MKKIIALCALLFSLQSQATIIEVALDKPDYELGDVVTASIWINDLTPVLTAYQMTLDFQPALLDFLAVSFGSALTLGMPTLTFDEILPTGILFDEMNIDAFSEEDLAALKTMQPIRFLLANLTFITKQAGQFQLSLSDELLTDGWGDSIAPGSYSLQSASGTIQPAAAVNAPGTLLLMLPLLALLARRRS